MPWATTKSQPLSTAAVAWRTLPHMLPTRTLLSWQEVDHVARHAEAGDEDPGAAVDHDCDLGCDLARDGGEQVDAERLGRELADLGHLLDHLLVAHRRRAEAAEAAGLRDGGGEAVVRDAAHAGQHHGVFDVEQVGEAGAHARIVPGGGTGPPPRRGDERGDGLDVCTGTTRGAPGRP